MFYEKYYVKIVVLLLVTVLTSCSQQNKTRLPNEQYPLYKSVKLTSDLSHLSINQKKMLSLLIDAAKVMDEIYWLQAFGNKKQFLNSIKKPELKHFAEINYGPWDRLNNNRIFIDGFSKKSLGANFYPKDMSIKEFSESTLSNKESLYSNVLRNKQGKLFTIAYHKIYQLHLQKASSLLIKASQYADNSDFKKYLKLRSKALLNDNFRQSDLHWMDMKNNPIDLVIGPIETYEDLLFGYRAAYEAYVLIKDTDWSKKLNIITSYLPELQKSLPVEEKYKRETPGGKSDLFVYDVIYYAGHSNAGAKTIAINLPNDEEVQRLKGTRRLQLKNTMQEKFKHILIPISQQLIASHQQKMVTFNAFFNNTMFHEIAHGLGIKNTIDGTTTVRKALKETASSIEEGKADVLGLHMISTLHRLGKIKQKDLRNNYVTFLASIFRSIRFGVASAHGKANLVRFNYFLQQGAFKKTKSGRYQIDFNQMNKATIKLSNEILRLQGNGDHTAAKHFIKRYGNINETLQQDLQQLTKAQIPVDLTFDQGKNRLDL